MIIILVQVFRNMMDIDIFENYKKLFIILCFVETLLKLNTEENFI